MISQDQMNEKERELKKKIGRRGRQRGDEENLEHQNKRKIRQEERDEIHEINSDQVIWREIAHSILNFLPNFSLLIFILL